MRKVKFKWNLKLSNIGRFGYDGTQKIRDIVSTTIPCSEKGKALENIL